MTKEEQKAYNRRYHLADSARFFADGGECEMHYSLDARLPE